jgi:hypothetical protein
LELGGGGLVVGLVGLELIFGVRRRGSPAPTKDTRRSEGSFEVGDTTTWELNSEVLDNLERLAQLRTSGALTEEEFAAHKAKLLAVPSPGRDVARER